MTPRLLVGIFCMFLPVITVLALTLIFKGVELFLLMSGALLCIALFIWGIKQFIDWQTENL